MFKYPDKAWRPNVYATAALLAPRQKRVTTRQKTKDTNPLTHWGRDNMAAISQTTILRCIFLNENVWISVELSLKFVPKGPIDNILALV